MLFTALMSGLLAVIVFGSVAIAAVGIGELLRSLPPDAAGDDFKDPTEGWGDPTETDLNAHEENR